MIETTWRQILIRADGGSRPGDVAGMAADGAGRRARYAAYCSRTALHAAPHVW